MSAVKTKEELVAEAQRFYDARLKATLEPERNGEFVAIDPEAGLFAVATDMDVARHDLKAQGSTGWQVLLRVGYPWTFEW